MAAPRPLLRDYGLGLAIGAVAVAFRALLQPLLGDQLPFLVAFPATVAASVLGGTGAGLLTALVCATAIATPQIPPNIAKVDRPLQIGAFLMAGAFIALLCGRVRKLGPPPSLDRLKDRAETPLTAWLRMVLWGSFLIPTTAFFIVGWWAFNRAEADAFSTAAHARDLVYGQALGTFTIVAKLAKRADQASTGEDASVRAHEREINDRLADMVAGVPSVVNLNVWDAAGRPLARSDPGPANPAVTVHDRRYFLDQLAAPIKLGISEVVIGRQSGRELLNATIRRSSPDGSFNGIVAVSLSPDFFRKYYESLATEEPKVASFALIRTDGVIIARWPKAADGRTQVPADSLVLQRILGGADSGQLLVSARQTRDTRLVSFRRVGTYPLYVVAGFSRDAMLASWFRFVAVLAAILIPTTAGLVYVSWVALRKTRHEQATFVELQDQIRRRASAERSMLESQRLETLAVVTGGVAHDFNNLLAIVSTCLHVLKRRHPDLTEERHVQSMSKAIQTGVRLTRQLLSFSRKQALRPETVRLQDWLATTEGLIQSTLGANVTRDFQIDPDTRPVTVDVGELELALINLVVNARHAMPNGGTLKLHVGNAVASAENGRAMVAISVADTGVGIPASLLPKVREPFFTTRTNGAGSGLGLSQVQGFCEQAGGSLQIDSTVGKGTTVWMYLPASIIQAEPSPAEESKVATRLSGLILLVEDNEDVASTTESLLLSAGLKVVRAANANAALVHVQAASTLPDAVLSDISMPGSLSGIGLAFELRQRFPTLPVVLTTGYAEHVKEAVAGGFRVLPKPVAPEDLLAELRSVLFPKEAEPQAEVMASGVADL